MKKLTVSTFVLTLALLFASCGGSQNAKVEKGSTISLGGHDWIVLEVIDGKKALVLSDKVIELRAYHSKDVSISWENCDLRKYLNGEFYKKTFSEKEKKRIIETEISNVGNKTMDKVFLLSSGEASISRYFKDNSERIALDMNTGEVCWWWLRSPGSYGSSYAASVQADGNVNVRGNDRVSNTGGVRPALWLKL